MQCPLCNSPNADSATVCRACGTPIVTINTGAGAGHLSIGTKLQGGAFCVGKILGQGGFGITYLGADTGLSRSVAIKEFFPSGCVRQRTTVHPAGAMTIGDYQEARQRFLDEARMLARFQHPGIVQVFASFEENNTAYMAMELVKGRTLMSLIEERGRVPESEAVEYISQAGEALAVVHAANLLHRDIKPDNLMVAANGRVVLLDFGTAREFASGKTKRMTAIVTPGYAPLEQYGQQAKFGIYTDVYALAATLYHAVTGEVPVQATDRASGVELPPPNRRMRDVSRSVSDAIMWAMEMKATARPQAVGEFLGALHGSLVPATVGDKAGNAVPAPQNRQVGQYAARIEQLIKEMEIPAPPLPPSSVDASINQLSKEIARYTSFPPPQQAACPACNASALERLTGDWTARCPICHQGSVAARTLDEALCAVCATGHLVRQRLEQPTMFCPVCQGMPLLQEKRKKFGLAVDLWWTCPGCKAEIDVLIGGKAKLVRFSRDPFGFGAKHLGQTFPLESWQQCTPLSQSRLWCSTCGATFYEFNGGTITLVGCQRDPRGIGRQCLGIPYPRITFIKLANNVPANAGNVHCAVCHSEFDHDAAAGTLAIVASDINAYPWTGAWRGKPRALREWSLMSAGKQSLKPGWLCRRCKTEFDDPRDHVPPAVSRDRHAPIGAIPLDEMGDQMRLVASSSAVLAPMVGQCLAFGDWHRTARGVPTTAGLRELQLEVIGLEAVRRAETQNHLERVEERRRQIQSELSAVFKHCVLDGLAGNIGSAPRRLRDGEVVRWQSAAARLKQRTRQGMPYWDIDDEGTLIVSSDRLVFDPSMGGRWERPLTKLNYADKEYVGGQTILVTRFDGRQKPIGFVVPDQEIEVTISGHTRRVTFCIDDFLAVLQQQCH